MTLLELDAIRARLADYRDYKKSRRAQDYARDVTFLLGELVAGTRDELESVARAAFEAYHEEAGSIAPKWETLQEQTRARFEIYARHALASRDVCDDLIPASRPLDPTAHRIDPRP